MRPSFKNKTNQIVIPDLGLEFSGLEFAYTWGPGFTPASHTQIPLVCVTMFVYVYVKSFIFKNSFMRSTLIFLSCRNSSCEYGYKCQKIRWANPSCHPLTPSLPSFWASSTLSHREGIPPFKSLLVCPDFWRAFGTFCGKWKGLIIGEKPIDYLLLLLAIEPRALYILSTPGPTDLYL